MLRVTRGAAPATSQSIEDQLTRLEAKVDTLIAMIGAAMEPERADEDEEIPSMYGERDQTQPL